MTYLSQFLKLPQTADQQQISSSKKYGRIGPMIQSGGIPPIVGRPVEFVVEIENRAFVPEVSVSEPAGKVPGLPVKIKEEDSVDGKGRKQFHCAFTPENPGKHEVFLILKKY
jgi:hypothetical protein